MKDKETGKKTLKFYSDLTNKQKKDIVYLPEFIQKDAALSSNDFKAVSGQKADTLLLSEFMQHSSLNARASSDKSHKLSANITGKAHFSGSSKSSSGRIRNSNIKKPSSKQESIKTSSQSLTNNKKELSVLNKNEKTIHQQFEKKEGKNILYLLDHFKKTGKTEVSSYKTADKVIPFPDHKHHPFLLPAGRKLQSAGIAVMACLLVVLGGKTVVTGIDNISKKIAGSSRDLANVVDENPTPTSSEIIKALTEKEISITKAVPIQTRTVASTDSPELSHDTSESPTDSSL